LHESEVLPTNCIAMMGGSTAAIIAAALILSLPDSFWQRCGAGGDDRVIYAALVLLLLRDTYGCFFLNLTRRPARAVRKPLGYDATTLRQPRWCPVTLLLRLCAPSTQRLAFATALGGSAALGVVDSATLRIVIALAYAIGELRFHAALGWHRNMLLLNTLVASALPRPCRATGRALALCHAYGGSGLRRLWTGGAFDGAALREVLPGARNGLFPRLTRYASKAPLLLLAALDAASRVGLELGGVALLLMYLEENSVHFAFRACTIAFHFGVALLTAIDFFENRVVLFLGLIVDDLSASASSVECSPWPSRVFAFALLFPVLAGIEHFPFTHNGLFPFSGRQMRAIRDVCDRNGVLLAATSNAVHIDLARTFLGLGETQPAQLWHPVLAPLVQAGGEVALHLYNCARLRRSAQEWLRTARPLVDSRTGAAYDRVAYHDPYC